MIGALQSFLTLLIAYVFVFSGLAFSNKQLLPQLLDGIYEQTGFILRIVIFTIVFSLPANFLMAKAFQLTSVSIAGPLVLVAILLTMIVNAMLIDKVNINLPILGATAGALFFCCLTAWLLEGQRAAG